MRLELFHQPRLLRQGALVIGVGRAPGGCIAVAMQGLCGFERLPQARHLHQRRHQRVIVVADGDARLEDLVFPLRVVLLDLPDQVAGPGVGFGFIGLGHDVQVHQNRGQQRRTGAQQEQTVPVGQSHNGLPSHSPVRVLRNWTISAWSSALGVRPS
ncbi:hypothetical protein D3C79_590330 [compost metagenome]